MKIYITRDKLGYDGYTSKPYFDVFVDEIWLQGIEAYHSVLFTSMEPKQQKTI